MDSRPTPQLAMALDMIDRYGAGVSNEKLEPPGLRVQTFYNSYPTFTDTNNLSLLTFLNVGPVSFVLPGDEDIMQTEAFAAR